MRSLRLQGVALGLLWLALGCQSLIGLPERSRDADGDVDAAVGGGGRSGAGGTGGAVGGKAGQCSAFCKRAVEICTDEYAIYHGSGDCEPACNLLTTDQVKCRDDELTKAFSSREPWDHCKAATLGGSTACGGNCENYCTFMGQVCTDANRDMSEAALTQPMCVDKCKQLVDHEFQQGVSAEAPRYNVDADHEGDSLQCRLVHLTIASGPGAADAHCWHAALAPRPSIGMNETNPCSTGKLETQPHCEDYCHIVQNACDDADHKVYESTEQCLAVCKELVPGNVSDASGDSVGCRKTHAYNALIIDATTHCPHAGPGGAGVCGNDCPAYCRMLKAGCDSAFKSAFGSGTDATSKCEADCRTVHGTDNLSYTIAEASKKDAGAMACRLLNAARALEKPDQAAQLCASAAGGGDCKR